MSQQSKGGSLPIALACFESGIARTLGDISYSLYLTHFQVLAMVHLRLNYLRITDNVQLILLPVITVPFSILVAYLFHHLFEKPLMKKPANA
jgi:peptidoglycan/LPS O-acetylase OafA/YrhL